jgi:hypothetical protein
MVDCIGRSGEDRDDQSQILIRCSILIEYGNSVKNIFYILINALYPVRFPVNQLRTPEHFNWAA